MDFDVAAWEKEIGRPVPALMAKFFTWLAPYEYGDLGYFELAPENLAGGDAWEGMERWGANTWAFLSLPDGSLIGLCEAVEPPAVVLIGSEGELRTLADSFEAFLLAIDAGETETEIDLPDDEREAEQVAARKAFTSWLNKSKIAAPAVSGQFDFSAYAAGDPPERRAPPTQHGAAPAVAPGYLDHIEGMGDRLKMLSSLVGRTAADPQLCALAEEVFGKAPPQSIGNAKRDDSIWLTAKKADISFLFSRKVLNPNYAPVQISAKAICPFLDSVYLGDAYNEPVLFGVHGDALWAAIALKLPQHYKETVDEDGEVEKECTLALDAARDTELKLWMNNGRTNACVQIRQGRELASPEAARQHNSGAGLFVQWALENGWLERSMFPGQDELLDAMRSRQARPSQLVQLGLARGLWDTHLTDEPGLRQFASIYFHHMDGIWINADLKAMFGKRQGQYGHDEPVLDDDPVEIYDALFAVFTKQFAAWKQANPQELA
ncbi:SMI1/KNR4 family protein [Massilia genomosp. 1]|uniref:Knr4/Smi1-like domain-containing protein n=1 Tax=Massilia genomosp. 1 TaxID=2609280 RepID=A0ABX0MDL0_9BURK|nr:SMI1/KNR4 family protein [Massilia genomosp. 1]NHZ60848.1 hypothetical protein [Massilia genomosp. 1]